MDVPFGVEGRVVTRNDMLDVVQNTTVRGEFWKK